MQASLWPFREERVRSCGHHQSLSRLLKTFLHLSSLSLYVLYRANSSRWKSFGVLRIPHCACTASSHTPNQSVSTQDSSFTQWAWDLAHPWFTLKKPDTPEQILSVALRAKRCPVSSTISENLADNWTSVSTLWPFLKLLLVIFPLHIVERFPWTTCFTQ